MSCRPFFNRTSLDVCEITAHKGCDQRSADADYCTTPQRRNNFRDSPTVAVVRDPPSDEIIGR